MEGEAHHHHHLHHQFVERRGVGGAGMRVMACLHTLEGVCGDIWVCAPSVEIILLLRKTGVDTREGSEGSNECRRSQEIEAYVCMPELGGGVSMRHAA